MLERDWPPIEADSEQIHCIHGQQAAPDYGGARAPGSPQQQEEQPEAGHAEQERRLAQTPDSGLEHGENRAVDPGLEGPQVAHQHEGQAGMAEVNDIAGARLQEGIPEQGFVVLDAEPRKKRLARQKEKSTSSHSEADAAHGYVDLDSGLYLDVENWPRRWTQRDFALTAGCPASQPQCRLTVSFLTPLGPFDSGERHRQIQSAANYFLTCSK